MGMYKNIYVVLGRLNFCYSEKKRPNKTTVID